MEIKVLTAHNPHPVSAPVDCRLTHPLPPTVRAYRVHNSVLHGDEILAPRCGTQKEPTARCCVTTSASGQPWCANGHERRRGTIPGSAIQVMPASACYVVRC